MLRWTRQCNGNVRTDFTGGDCALGGEASIGLVQEGKMLLPDDDDSDDAQECAIVDVRFQL